MAYFEGKLIALIALLLSGRDQPQRPPVGPPRPPLGPRDVPGPSVEPGIPVAPPFPVQPPSDLPAFPGPGWEYDEPVSAAVMQRATQLLSVLYGPGQGLGSSTLDFVAGAWRGFLAERLGNGKNGVTAWRVRGAAPSPAPAAPSVPSAASLDVPIIPSTVVVPVHPSAGGMAPKDIQDALNHLGFGPLAVDGIIGPLTKSAIKRFQAANPPLAVDGIAGPQTQSVLQAKLSALHDAPVVLPPTPVGLLVQTPRDVQHALNVLGYGPLTEDGIAGPKTASAVRDFQGHHPPLAVDGIAGPQTKSALSAALQNMGAAA